MSFAARAGFGSRKLGEGGPRRRSGKGQGVGGVESAGGGRDGAWC